MRVKKPHIASLDQVSIMREGDSAVIEYKEPNVGAVNLVIGPRVHDMGDREILDLHNEIILTQREMAREYEHVAVEVPVGRPQVKYFKEGDQWVPRGDVLRCLISDGGPDGEVTVFIDDLELSLSQFGRLLGTFAGWGMRVFFVPEDDICKQPLIETLDPVEDVEDIP